MLGDFGGAESVSYVHWLFSPLGGGESEAYRLIMLSRHEGLETARSAQQRTSRDIWTCARPLKYRTFIFDSGGGRWLN